MDITSRIIAANRKKINEAYRKQLKEDDSKAIQRQTVNKRRAEDPDYPMKTLQKDRKDELTPGTSDVNEDHMDDCDCAKCKSMNEDKHRYTAHNHPWENTVKRFGYKKTGQHTPPSGFFKGRTTFGYTHPETGHVLQLHSQTVKHGPPTFSIFGRGSEIHGTNHDELLHHLETLHGKK